jgi:hypothetical protein
LFGVNRTDDSNINNFSHGSGELTGGIGVEESFILVDVLATNGSQPGQRGSHLPTGPG